MVERWLWKLEAVGSSPTTLTIIMEDTIEELHPYLKHYSLDNDFDDIYNTELELKEIYNNGK